MPTIEIEIPKLHAGQCRIVEQAKRFNVLECGRRWGKTTFGEHVAIESAIEGKVIGWFAPTHKLMDRSWSRIAHTLQPITSRIDRQQCRIELVTRGTLDFWSADHPDSGRGRKYHKAIIDEAGIVRDLEDVWNGTIRPTLTDFKGEAWFLGTPKGRRYFHELFSRGQGDNPDWKSWRMPTVDNPHIDPLEVEAARRDMPDQAFRQEYLGEPADDGGNPFGIARIGQCLAPLSTGKPVAFGVDLAKSHDWCVVCGLDENGNVCTLERWQSDWGATRARILSLVNGWPTLVDSTGVGDPIVEDLHRVRGNIQGFRFSSTSKQQIMEGLAAAIHQQAVRFPDGWLHVELDSFEYEYTRTGVRYSAPTGLHDDGVCALALAWNHFQSGRSQWCGVVQLPDTDEQDD